MESNMAQAPKKGPSKKKMGDSFEKLSKDLAVNEEHIQQLIDGTWPSWPTGSVVADLIMGIGGFPQGRIVECYGKPSSGKSALFMACAGHVQRAGKKVVMLDFERTFDPQWAKTLGMDPYDKTTFAWIKSENIKTMEEGFNILYKILDSPDAKDIGLIIWDSLAGASPQAIANKDDVGKASRVASRASVLSEELPKLAEKLESGGHTTTVGFVNQMRKNLDMTGYGPKDTTPGGFAFEHAASMRLSIKHKGFETKTTIDEFTLEKRIEKIGQRVIFTVEKTKHGQRGRTAEAIFMFQNGFDNVRTLVELAGKRGDFEAITKLKFKVPAKFTSDGKEVEGTEETLRKYFYNDKVAYDLLEAHIREDVERVYRDKVDSFSFADTDGFISVDETSEVEKLDSKTIDLENLED